MNQKDFNKFAEEWQDAHAVSCNPKQQSDRVIVRVFEMLSNYPFNEVSKALIMHGLKSKYGPTPHEINEILTENLNPLEAIKKDLSLTPDDIITLALAKNTPLGVFSAAFITSWDLSNQKRFYLIDRAKEFLIEFDSLLQRSLDADYTDYELGLLKKYNIDLLTPLSPGFPKPQPKPDLKLISNKKDDDDDSGLIEGVHY